MAWQGVRRRKESTGPGVGCPNKEGQMTDPRTVVTASRRLGGFEFFFYKAHQMGMAIMYFIWDVEGPITKELLSHATRAVMKRHPNLRSRIRRHRLEVLPFDRNTRAPISVVDNGQTASEFLEDQFLETEVATGSDHLWEAFLVYEPAKPSTPTATAPQERRKRLAFLVNHSIMDGDSMLHMVRELSEFMMCFNGRSEAEINAKIDGLDELPQCGAVEDYLVTHNRMAWSWRDVATIVMSYLVWPFSSIPHVETSSKPHTRIGVVEVPPMVTKQLLQRCRKEGTTITGALAAAAMYEVRNRIAAPQSWTQILLVETLWNLRSEVVKVDPALSGSLALQAAPMNMYVKVPGPKSAGGQSLWPLAAQFKTKLTQVMQTGQVAWELAVFTGFKYLGWVWFVCFYSFMWLVSGRIKSLSVSNLGRIDDRISSSALTPTAVSPSAADAPATPQVQEPVPQLTPQLAPYEPLLSPPALASPVITLSHPQWGVTQQRGPHYIFLAASTQEGKLSISLSTTEKFLDGESVIHFGQAIVRRLASSLYEGEEHEVAASTCSIRTSTPFSVPAIATGGDSLGAGEAVAPVPATPEAPKTPTTPTIAAIPQTAPPESLEPPPDEPTTESPPAPLRKRGPNGA